MFLFWQAFIALCSITVGITCVWSGAGALRRAHNGPPRQPVPGKILRSRVVRKGSYYAPEVAYRYVADGREYESSTIGAIGVSSSFKRMAQDVVDRYHATQSVVVFVDPRDHSNAMLEPGDEQLAALVGIVVGLLVTCFGVFWLLAHLGLIPGVEAPSDPSFQRTR